MLHEAYRRKSEKERAEQQRELLRIYSFVLSDEEAAAAKKTTGPYGRIISSHSGPRLCHARKGTFDSSYFTDPQTRRFCFPKYKHDNKYLVKIRDTTNHREDHWVGFTREEKSQYTLRDFEENAYGFDLEVDPFSAFAAKAGNPYLGELKPLRADLEFAEELIDSFHFEEFCFLDEKSERVLVKHGYVFQRDIVSGEDKKTVMEDLSMASLRELARPHGIKLGGRKAELRQRLIDSGVEFDLPSCYVASPKLMAWYAGMVNGYVSEIKKNAARFHPIYHQNIWSEADGGGEYNAVEIKLDAIRKTEYWLEMME